MVNSCLLPYYGAPINQSLVYGDRAGRLLQGEGALPLYNIAAAVAGGGLSLPLYKLAADAAGGSGSPSLLLLLLRLQRKWQSISLTSLLPLLLLGRILFYCLARCMLLYGIAMVSGNLQAAAGGE